MNKLVHTIHPIPWTNPVPNVFMQRTIFQISKSTLKLINILQKKTIPNFKANSLQIRLEYQRNNPCWTTNNYR